MAFTQDELQAFNNILDQKLSTQRRELERGFDQRLLVLRREFEQRLAAVQQEVLRSLGQRMDDQQRALKELLGQRVEQQHLRNTQEMTRSLTQKQQAQQQQFEHFVERSLAAQLLALEQLINQHLAAAIPEFTTTYGEQPPDFEAIEVQTEIPWEDLGQAFGKVLDERLALLNDTLQASLKNIENYLSTLLLNVREEVIRSQGQSYSGTITNVQELFHSIEQLEQIIESMQVAMTANHALLSNRLYHHQQLPLERAHPRSQATAPASSETLSNGANTPLTLPRERNSSTQ